MKYNSKVGKDINNLDSMIFKNSFILLKKIL